MPSFTDKINNISLQKRKEKFNQKIDRLTKEIEKKIRIITSNGIDDKVDTLRKIKLLTKNLEKLQLILDMLLNNKEQIENKSNNQYIKNAGVVVKDLEKVQQLLYDIDNSNNALKLLKQGNPENYSVDFINKINKDLQNKQKQFIDKCKHLPEVTKPAS